jgi:hypothetical protein
MNRSCAAVLITMTLPWLPQNRLHAQTTPARDSLHACDLATNADVAKATGRQPKRPPEKLSTVQQTESACDFYEALVQVALLTSLIPAEKLQRVLDGNGFDRAPHPLAGVGDSATVYFRPQGGEPEAFLVAYAGTRTVTVRVQGARGKPAESARPAAVALAKVAVGRLR